jgi:hypothetical protein
VDKGRNALGLTNRIPAKKTIGYLRKQKKLQRIADYFKLSESRPDFFYECILLPVFITKK